jgi:hypothetical protein
MLSRELQTLPRMEFTDTQASVRSPIGVRFPGRLGAMNFSGSTVAAERRVNHAVVCARAADAVSAVSLRDGAALEARMG